MKIKIVYLTVVVILFYCLYACQFKEDKKQNVSEMIILDSMSTSGADAYRKKYIYFDSIPEWVKDKIPEERYELLKVMSSRFAIDYSFVEKKLSESQKDEIFRTITVLAKEVKEGKYDNNYPITFSVLY